MRVSFDAFNSPKPRALPAVSTVKASPRARGGRPTLYVPKIVDRLLAYIGDGLNIKQACAAAGVSPRTLADWRMDHPEIVPRLEAAREASRAKALAKIKAASKDDWRSIAEWLRLSFSQGYMRGNSVTVNANAQAGVAVELSDPERAALIEKRERALAGSPSSERELTEHERAIDAHAERKALPAPKERYVQMTKHGRFVRQLPDGSVIDAEATPAPSEEADTRGDA